MQWATVVAHFFGLLKQPDAAQQQALRFSQPVFYMEIGPPTELQLDGSGKHLLIADAVAAIIPAVMLILAVNTGGAGPIVQIGDKQLAGGGELIAQMVLQCQQWLLLEGMAER